MVYLFQLEPIMFTYLRAVCPSDVTTFLDLTSFSLLTGSGRVGSRLKNPDPVPSLSQPTSDTLSRDYNCHSTTIRLLSDYDVSRAPACVHSTRAKNEHVNFSS